MLSLPLMRKTFIEAREQFFCWWRADLSLPLMRKTFIEASMGLWVKQREGVRSLPLMRKTFIEAILPGHVHGVVDQVSSAYAEDFH